MRAAATARAVDAIPGPATGGRASTRQSRSRFRVTVRGVGMLALGIAVAILGVGFATPILVYIGVAMVCAVILSSVWVAVAVRSFIRSHTQIFRQVVPHPLTAHKPGEVAATLYSTGQNWTTALRRPVTERVDVREQAAAELTGGGSAKATVERGQGTLTLHYGLHPVLRGRWPLGPALVRSTDPFGLMYVDTPAGDAHPIPVWPEVVDLSGTAGALMGHAEFVARGARTPSSDDAALREYREGDDLRRVHWPSSARRGSMVVRTDERAGRRPATVILDPPSDPGALEYAISAAASIAVSVISASHPVRLVGAGLDPATTRHLGERGGDAARHELLNQTIDLSTPDSRNAAIADLVRSARLVAEDIQQGEVTVAVLEPLEEHALRALAPLGETGRAWAIVRTEPELEEQAAYTVASLRKAGWRVTTMYAHEDFEHVWTRLLATGDIG